MIRNGKIVSDYDLIRARCRAHEARAHCKEGYPEEWRISVAGRVVSHNKHSANIERQFFDHLRAAITDPGAFVFDGAIGKESADTWLANHAARLKVEEWRDVLLIGPDNEVIDFFNLSE